MLPGPEPVPILHTLCIYMLIQCGIFLSRYRGSLILTNDGGRYELFLLAKDAVLSK